MPKSKNWPYPLAKGTHVIASVYHFQQDRDVQVVGIILGNAKRPNGKGHPQLVYHVKANGQTVETLAGRTIPVDTTTPEGLEIWMDAIEREQRTSEERGASNNVGLPEPKQPETQSPLSTTTTLSAGSGRYQSTWGLNS